MPSQSMDASPDPSNSNEPKELRNPTLGSSLTLTTLFSPYIIREKNIHQFAVSFIF